MSRVIEFIKHEHEEHIKVLQETPVDAHVHTLWIRRMESQQSYLQDHVPDNSTRKKMIGLVQELRQLIGKALEVKE